MSLPLLLAASLVLPVPSVPLQTPPSGARQPRQNAQNAQNPQNPQNKPAPPAAPSYTFPSGAGMLFFYVKPDKAADFEQVVARLVGALEKSTDATRRQQAASWRIYRSIETPKDGVIYVFAFDPAVEGADYDPVRILSEAAPADVQNLYDRLKEDVIRVERMGLKKVK